MAQHHQEVFSGERFSFGSNWRQFLELLDEERIIEAEKSLAGMLEMSSLAGKRILDAGSGSGLFSLAARRLGAVVHSFDYDPQSVACTLELRHRFYPDDSLWTVEEGSVLDPHYLESLGPFDIVYSWGVLHHTGAMWTALGNVIPCVAPSGLLYVSIYNDQGRKSRIWTSIKKLYNRSPYWLRFLLVVGIGAIQEFRIVVGRLLQLKNPLPFKRWAAYKKMRGMSYWHDLVDWVGGYPFEVARPEEIFDFYRQRGFCLTRLKTCGGGPGCNEFVFIRADG